MAFGKNDILIKTHFFRTENSKPCFQSVIFSYTMYTSNYNSTDSASNLYSLTYSVTNKIYQVTKSAAISSDEDT